MSLSGVAIIWFWPAKLGRKIPASIFVILLGAILTSVLDLNERFGVATLESQFGAMPRGLPGPHVPVLSWSEWRALIPAGLTVAVVGAIESLLCAVVSDGMIDDRHDSNQELVGQGIANIACAFFGGMPATGVIARTATNVRSGAKTPVAGIIHAIVLLLVLLLAAPLAGSIPLAALSAVLVVVALRMGEWHQFTRLKRWPKSDVAVFLTAFVLTVVADLPVAVGASLVLASALLVKRLSETTNVSTDEEVTHAHASGPTTTGRVLPPGVMAFRVFGAFFFGAADKLETSLRRAGQLPEVLILRMRDVLAIDATGLDALEDLYEKLSKHHKELILCAPHSQPMIALSRSGLLDKLGMENVCADLDAAIARSRTILESRAAKH